MPNQKIKAVLFDLGETLLVFGKLNKLRLLTSGAKNSYKYLIDNNQPIGSFWFYFLHSLLVLYYRRVVSHFTGNDFNSLDVLKQHCMAKGIRLTDIEWLEYNWCWYEPLGSLAKIEPDLAKTLSSLSASGLKLGILSNTFVSPETLNRHLEQLGLLKFFDLVIYTCQYTCRKPDRKIFEIARDKLGIKFSDIVFVGDRLDNDTIPAVALGMQAVLKTAHHNIGKTIPKIAHRLDRLSQLPTLIHELDSQTAQCISSD